MLPAGSVLSAQSDSLDSLSTRTVLYAYVYVTPPPPSSCILGLRETRENAKCTPKILCGVFRIPSSGILVGLGGFIPWPNHYHHHHRDDSAAYYICTVVCTRARARVCICIYVLQTDSPLIFLLLSRLLDFLEFEFRSRSAIMYHVS